MQTQKQLVAALNVAQETISDWLRFLQRDFYDNKRLKQQNCKSLDWNIIAPAVLSRPSSFHTNGARISRPALHQF